MSTPSEAEYDEAKQRYSTWTEAQHRDPAPAMLADVQTINAFELELGKAEANAEAERRATHDG